MNPTAMPKRDLRRDVRNRLLLVFLLAVAVSLHAAIVMKINRFGHGET